MRRYRWSRGPCRTVQSCRIRSYAGWRSGGSSSSRGHRKSFGSRRRSRFRSSRSFKMKFRRVERRFVRTTTSFSVEATDWVYKNELYLRDLKVVLELKNWFCLGRSTRQLGFNKSCDFMFERISSKMLQLWLYLF